MMKIGCGTVLFRQYELERALAAIREAGFEYFETQAVGPWCPHVDVWKDDPEHLVALKNKYGFKGITGLWALGGSIIGNDQCIDSIRRSIEWAAAAGIPVVHFGEGRKPDNMSDDEAFALMGERLAVLCEAARGKGVKLALEPHGTYSLTMKGLTRILTLGGADVLGVNFDAANVFRACFVDTGNPGARWQKIENREDETEVLRAVLDRVIHMHAKDLNDRLECVPVGEGLVKVEECVKLLDGAGYEGAVSVETEGDSTFEEAAELARRSYKALCRMTGQNVQ